METKMSLKYAIASLALLPLIGFAASAGATGVNLVTNGNFTTAVQTGSSSEVVNTSGATGEYVAGWTTTSTDTVLITPAIAAASVSNPASTGTYTNTYQSGLSLYTAGNSTLISPVGGNFVAVDADVFQGTLSQTITGLTVGHTYAVSFYQAGAQEYGNSGATGDQWFVSLGSQTDYAPQINVVANGFSGWSYVTEMFTATAATETLGFFANGVGAPPFALLDGVSLVDAPEPATWTVMIMGLLGVASARRWARTRR